MKSVDVLSLQFQLFLKVVFNIVLKIFSIFLFFRLQRFQKGAFSFTYSLASYFCLAALQVNFSVLVHT